MILVNGNFQPTVHSVGGSCILCDIALCTTGLYLDMTDLPLNPPQTGARKRETTGFFIGAVFLCLISLVVMYITEENNFGQRQSQTPISSAFWLVSNKP